MKHFLKITALAAALMASATYASADTLTISSYGTNANGTGYVPPVGVSNTALAYNGYNQSDPTPSSNPNAATFDLATGNPGNGSWADPIGSSSWVSYNGQTGPTGNFVAPDGFYTYTTTFQAEGGKYAGYFAFLADDSTAVYLNGNMANALYALPLGATYGHCASQLPDCTTPAFYSFDSLTLLAGTNTLTFVVDQHAEVSTGLDFYGQVSSVPEPSTLLMLGTGLIGSAGALFRKMRA